MKTFGLILYLGLVACSVNEPTVEPWTGTVQLDVPFALPFNGIATVEGEGLTITFSGDVIDSRCPTNRVCVIPGSVVIEIELKTETGEQATIMLRSWQYSTSENVSVEMFGYSILILGVDPARGNSDETILDEDYVVTVELQEL